MKCALTIAGSDSSAGAGIQADLKTFAALGVYGTSVLTAVTAQNTLGVQGILEVPPEFVRLQIDAVMSDIGADAVKTGMLASAANIRAIAENLERWGVTSLVVDPVLAATSGDLLCQPEAREVLIDRLLPMARVVTPNVPEAQVFTGLEINSLEDMREAAMAIHRMGPQNVVVKGGHLADAAEAVDVLYDGREFHEFAGPWIESQNAHGTGCTFASAIAAGLAQGKEVPEAVRVAKEYLAGALRGALKWQLGRGHGPVNHFWRMS